MKILGIETATPLLGVALLSKSGPLFHEERFTVSQSSHCELITGFIQDLTGRAGISLRELDCIAVSIGPGSFTGLRIGIASAMGLAWSMGKPVCSVSTLMGLAWAVSKPGALVCPLIDAKRGEAYAAVYRLKPDAGIPETILQPAALPIGKLIEHLSVLQEPVILTGPGVELFGLNIREGLPSYNTGISAEPPHPSALAIAELGVLLMRAGQAVPPSQVRPVYLRRSDAEIARDRKTCRL